MIAETQITLRPQEGPQMDFLASSADIVIYGGAAGGGKTFGLLLEPLRHVHDPKFTGVILRRTSTQVRKAGALWDESMDIYPLAFGTPRQQALEWQFPSGAKIGFGSIEHEKDKLNWQGSQICYLGFDELTHFTESMFFYMLSRLRSDAKASSYIRATCNPDADSWVADFIRWWWHPDTGYAIPERSGVVRWFLRVDGQVEWADTRQELVERFSYLARDGRKVQPKSATFIPATLTDNKILMDADPGYEGSLQALQIVDRERLLHGNWLIRHTTGTMFKRDWIEIVEKAPVRGQLVRYWDKAGSEMDEGDATAGILGMLADDLFYVCDLVHGRWSPGSRNRVMKTTANMDLSQWGSNLNLWVEKEPGNGGKESAQISGKELRQYGVKFDAPVTNKVARAMNLSAFAENSRIRIVRAPWNRTFIDELIAFPSDDVHDDIVDATSGSFNKLIKHPTSSARPRGVKL